MTSILSPTSPLSSDCSRSRRSQERRQMLRRKLRVMSRYQFPKIASLERRWPLN
jgi:hypothetical protein